MSTSVIEPGTPLAGRYRLERRVSRSGGSTLWKATDEILARAVAVRTFEPDFALISEAVMAARSASRLTDPRLTQVFDADNSGEYAYVVSEWVVGTTLEEMVSSGGPMEPGRAATLLGEASEAIAAAHLAGLAHLRLSPRDLLWTTGNTVKILGLGVDAALAGTTSADPAMADTQGLAHMLYLALTAYWPGTAACKLPSAPSSNGLPCPPQQLRPEISHPLNRIVSRSLGVADGQEPPLTSPAKLAEALSGVPRVPLPLFAGYPQGPPPAVVQRPAPGGSQRTRAMPTPPPTPPSPHGPPHVMHQPAPVSRQPAAASYSVGAPPPGGARLGAGGGGRVGTDKRVLLGVAAGLAALVIGVTGWQLAGTDKPSSGGAPPMAAGPPVAEKKEEVKLSVQGVTGLDEPNPLHPGHGDASVSRNADAVLDERTSSVWNSESYTSADFGSYVRGLGVRLDMGKSVKITRVKVVLAGQGGATMELRIGDDQTPGSMQRADRKTDVSGTVELHNSKELAGQYVLVWFATPAPAGFKAQVSAVTVYGRPE